ncbi:MAG: hypothetical protein IJG30_01185, partial [Synergistaceae bacterium]|nr:hypothetical protein [Synergistaceae bacterium]
LTHFEEPYYFLHAIPSFPVQYSEVHPGKSPEQLDAPRRLFYHTSFDSRQCYNIPKFQIPNFSREAEFINDKFVQRPEN